MLRLGKLIVPDLDVVTLRFEELSIEQMQWLEPFEVTICLERNASSQGAFREAYLAKSIKELSKRAVRAQKVQVSTGGRHRISLCVNGSTHKKISTAQCPGKKHGPELDHGGTSVRIWEVFQQQQGLFLFTE